MKFSADSANEFRHADVTGYSYPIAGRGCSLSRLVVEGQGRPPQPEDLKHSFVFYVEQGHGTFWVGSETFPVGPRDLVQVPMGTPYRYEGQMLLVEFMMPAWDPT